MLPRLHTLERSGATVAAAGAISSTNHVASSTSALFLEDELIPDGSDIAVVDVPPYRLTRTTVTKLAQRTAAIAAPATTTCLRVGLVLEEGLVRA
jgi:hypothetical protein